MQSVTTWYSLFLNQTAFQENKIYNFKTYLFTFLNTKQTNDDNFSKQDWGKF